MDSNTLQLILGKHLEFVPSANTKDNLAVRCPFHKNGQERTPSFYMYVGPPTHKKSPGDSYCFTCAEGWHLPGLLRKLKVGYAHIDAVKKHLDVLQPKKEKWKVDLEQQVLPEVVLGPFDFRVKPLEAAGFSPELLERYEIGFDRSRKRITFPVRNHKGELVGVSGRTVIDEVPRYKIYRSEFHDILPGYHLDKSKVLWGLDKFYVSETKGKDNNAVIVCEGFKAALKVVQSGYKNVVATMGVSLSDTQRWLLSRVTDDVILFLDNNDAGIKGTRKAYYRLRRNLCVSVANYPRRVGQPDELTKEEIATAINGRLSYSKWCKKHDRRKETKLQAVPREV